MGVAAELAPGEEGNPYHYATRRAGRQTTEPEQGKEGAHAKGRPAKTETPHKRARSMRDWLGKWILDDNHQPVKIKTDTDEGLIKWGRWFENHENRRVAEDFTRYYRLSSVFLGIDRNFSDRGPPLLFETMLFERKPTVKLMFGKLRQYNEEAFADQVETCWRFATWDDTFANHMSILHRLQKQEAEAIKLLAKHNITEPEETDEEQLKLEADTVSEQLSALTGESFQAMIVRPPKSKS